MPAALTAVQCYHSTLQRTNIAVYAVYECPRSLRGGILLFYLLLKNVG